MPYCLLRIPRLDSKCLSGAKPENKENSQKKWNNSSSFVNLKHPSLQEVRNKAKQEKLRNRQKVTSQERVYIDDSEFVDEGDNKIGDQNKNYISKQKTKRTIMSINKSIKDQYGSRNSNMDIRDELQVYTNTFETSPLGRKLRFGEKKNSITIFNKPQINTTKTIAVDAFYGGNGTSVSSLISVSNENRNSSGIKSSKHEKRLHKTSKCSFGERALSSTSQNSRSRSNANKNRHFQIKHEPSKLSSLVSFQNLISNFPDIKCSSNESINTTSKVDNSSIHRKATELKKYMSSGMTNQGFSFNVSKSNRQRHSDNEQSWFSSKLFTSLFCLESCHKQPAVQEYTVSPKFRDQFAKTLRNNQRIESKWLLIILFVTNHRNTGIINIGITLKAIVDPLALSQSCSVATKVGKTNETKLPAFPDTPSVEIEDWDDVQISFECEQVT